MFDFSASPYPVRDDLAEAFRGSWRRLARPGTWWSGAERVAIAAEMRAARHCALCRGRVDALSPGAVQGRHDRAGSELPDAAVDVIHRVVTDPARLSKRWFDDTLASDLDDAHYVEAVSVATHCFGIDEFHRVLGLPFEPLPAPEAGEPSRRRPAGAAMEGAWVPMQREDRLAPEDADLYGVKRTGNIFRALSLVPEEVRQFRALGDVMYFSAAGMRDLGNRRALDRAQIELLASRVSATNECFY